MAIVWDRWILDKAYEMNEQFDRLLLTISHSRPVIRTNLLVYV